MGAVTKLFIPPRLADAPDIYEFRCPRISKASAWRWNSFGEGARHREHRQRLRLRPPSLRGWSSCTKPMQTAGLVVLGFPCNQFGSQDPGSNDEIASFCQLNYGVSFPMMAKIDVNGANASPLYQWLTAEAPGLLGSKAIKWNFTKFLVGKDGRVIRRYAPQDAPKKLVGILRRRWQVKKAHPAAFLPMLAPLLLSNRSGLWKSTPNACGTPHQSAKHGRHPKAALAGVGFTEL